MLDINGIEKVIKTEKFINRYAQGKNLPLNFYCSEVKVEELANGEYNYNYLLRIRLMYEDREINEKAVFRVNYGSQMHLENQMEYEYMALDYLKYCGVTPSPVFIDTSREILPKDYLVMDFVEGVQLDYNKDLKKAAKCLAAVHGYRRDFQFDFIEPDNPFEAMIDECTQMYGIYENSGFFDENIDFRIKKVFESAKKLVESAKGEKNHCKGVENTLINTELNSSNFIVDGEKCTLIDWEKPILGEIEQDLGHFLAPTTTFWKTDVILSKEKIDDFLSLYYNIYVKINSDSNIREFTKFKERVYTYIVFNCLRGLTWCAMAWVEYNNAEKALINEFTYNKLKDYLKISFIDNVIQNFIDGSYHG